MNISEMLLQITTNEQTTVNELNDILTLQDELINPKITFYFGGSYHTLLEKEAYWTDKISFPADWDPSLIESVSNNNGYAYWAIYTIEDSEGNLIKYSDPIKNNETYLASFKIGFTIKIDDENIYSITAQGNGYEAWIFELPNSDSRFVYNDDGNLYFTPENNGLTYKVLYPKDAYSIGIGSILEAVLVERGNE